MTSAIVQAKAWWQSRMMWLGIAQFVLGVAELIVTTPIFEGSAIAGGAAMVSGALTMALRFVTDRPVASTEKPVRVES